MLTIFYHFPILRNRLLRILILLVLLLTCFLLLLQQEYIHVNKIHNLSPNFFPKPSVHLHLDIVNYSYPDFIPPRNYYYIEPDEFESSRTCKIPSIYPFEIRTMELLKQSNSLIPVCLANLNQSTKFKTDHDTKLIRLNPEDSFWTQNNCCYTPITGHFNHSNTGVSCIEINDDVTIIPSVWDIVSVHCVDVKAKKKTTHLDVFYFLRLNASKEARLDDKLQMHEKESGYKKEPMPNILFLVIDTLSFTSFRRFLPKTRHFLVKNLGGIEFTRMNKVGFGTIENMVPMTSNCDWKNALWGETVFPSPTEECQLIWEKYEKLGYRTGVTSDTLWTRLYEKMRRGDKGTNNGTYENYSFLRLRDEIFTKYGTNNFSDNHGCSSGKFAADIISDRILQVARKLRQKPYFHFSFLTMTTTHITSMAKYLDNPFYDLLRILFEEGLLDNTILVLGADHGTITAEYEESFTNLRMEGCSPLLLFVFPRWFEMKYSEAMFNFKRNSRGLVTPRDTYKTFASLSNLSSITNEAIRAQKEQPVKGLAYSLFYPIPLDRNCQDANILQPYCLCPPNLDQNIADYKTNTRVKLGVDYVLQHVNDALMAYPDCVELKLSEITGAESLDDQDTGIKYIRLHFNVDPSGGSFNALVETTGTSIISNYSATPLFKLSGHVERTNLYGRHPPCLEKDRKMLTGWVRSACHCKIYANNSTIM